MQIIEVTDLGVRSAVIRLKRRDTPLQYVLYPMIHMAKPSFYAAVTRRLERADVVVVEGVSRSRDGGTVLVRALTFSYRVLRFNRRTRLVEQDIDYASLDAEIVRPDVDSAQFKAAWRRIPLADRLVLAALRRLHEERADEAIEVAVVYGAGHVPAIVTGLLQYGYRARSGEWLILADV